VDAIDLAPFRHHAAALAFSLTLRQRLAAMLQGQLGAARARLVRAETLHRGFDAAERVLSQPKELSNLAAKLYARRAEAIEVPFLDVHVSHWRPHPGLCHANADFYALVESCKAVRGWFVVDRGDAGFMFVPHSVVETQDGTLVDITPPRDLARPRFLRHIGDDFDELIGSSGLRWLMHER
jgi:hypothetical protein